MEDQDHISVAGSDFEARIIMAISIEAEGNTKRHGPPGFLSCWKQDREKDTNEITTISLPSPSVEMATNSQLSFAFVILHVRLKSKHTENYMLQFHRSIGGHDKVFCECNNLPLISTGRRGKKNKRQCMREGCSGRERYICSWFQSTP